MQTHSVNSLAEQFEVDRGTMVKALKSVSPDLEKTRGRPTYKISTAARALEAHQKKRNGGEVGGESTSAGLTEQRVRIAKAKADEIELKNKIAQGKVTSVREVGIIVGTMFSVIRERALATPAKCADALTPHTPQDRTAIYEILHREFREMLLDMSTAGLFEAALAKAQNAIDAADNTTADTADNTDADAESTS